MRIETEILQWKYCHFLEMYCVFATSC